MAIIIISSTTFAVNTDTTPIQFSHVVPSGTELLLFGYGAVRDGGTVTFSSVTYNGDALTSKIAKTYVESSAWTSSGLWALLNPDVGTYNIVGTPSGSCNGGFVAINLSGVKITSPYGSTHSAAAQGTSIDTALTLTKDQIMIGICGFQTDSGNSASLTSGTAIYNNVGSSNDGFYYHNSSGARNTGIGVKHCSWTQLSSGWSAVSLALNAAPAGGEPVSISPFFNFFKNFENPWMEQGGLWQPNKKGLVTI